ncbi:MAG TPA: hypothetical protein VFM93_03530 [Candidatus Limnocylindria bacterium]|nr:hypothetical protein [Candidatus Limnocylindria bacterium]
MLRTGGMSPDTALTIGLAAGWMALVVAFAWPTPHCTCCPQRSRDREREKTPR